jgi:Tfp pilus assembly protein PilV
MTRIKHFRKQPDSVRTDGQSGLGLAEFLVSILILLVIAASVFGLLSEIQRKTGYQAEVQSVLNNTQLAMQMVGRYIRQAGNDPLDSGFTGITIMDPSRIGIASDLTGSESLGTLSIPARMSSSVAIAPLARLKSSPEEALRRLLPAIYQGFPSSIMILMEERRLRQVMCA